MKETTQETEQKPTYNPDKNKRRNSLFSHLTSVLKLSDEKIKSKGNSDRQKQGWARVMIAAISTYGQILKDSELEEIEERLTKLETEKELQKYR